MISIVNEICIIILWIFITAFNILKIDDSKSLKFIMGLECIMIIVKTLQVIAFKLS